MEDVEEHIIEEFAPYDPTDADGLGADAPGGGILSGGITPIGGILSGASSLVSSIGGVVGMFRGDQAQKNVKLGLQVEVKKAQIDRIKETQKSATTLMAVLGVGAFAVAGVIMWNAAKKREVREKAANPRRRRTR